MSRQVHFVVTVDLDEGVPFIDDATFAVMFENKRVFDTEKNEWREEDYETEYLPALKILNTIPLAKD